MNVNICARIGMVLVLAGLGWSSLVAAPRIKFLKSSHYFGTVKEEEGPVSHKFYFVNAGSEPVKIQAKPSCGCTTLDYTRRPVAPRDTGYVHVVFDPRGRPGVFKKTVSVYAVGNSKPSILYISGQVRPRPKGPVDYYPFVDGHLRFQTNHLTYGRLRDDERKTMTTVIYNGGHRPVRLGLRQTEVPPWLHLHLSAPAIEPGDTLQLVATYDAALRQEYGFVFDQIYIQSDDDQRPLKTLRFSANIRERFTGKELSRPAKMVLGSTQLDFGEVDAGGTSTQPLSITNKGRSDLVIRRVWSQCSCLDFKLARDTIPPGESETLLVTFDGRGRRGKEKKEFKIIANTPHLPERTLMVDIDLVTPPSHSDPNR